MKSINITSAITLVVAMTMASTAYAAGTTGTTATSAASAATAVAAASPTTGAASSSTLPAECNNDKPGKPSYSCMAAREAQRKANLTPKEKLAEECGELKGKVRGTTTSESNACGITDKLKPSEKCKAARDAVTAAKEAAKKCS